MLSLRLQDEMEELRSEMLEMRDMYMEEDVYQLQELRQQLEQVHMQADGHAKRDLLNLFYVCGNLIWKCTCGVQSKCLNISEPRVLHVCNYFNA